MHWMQWMFRGNHLSFMRTWAMCLEPPSLEIIRRYLNKGFGERLTSREAAERKLNHTCFPAPLGNVTTTKRMWLAQTSYHSGPQVEQSERCALDRGAGCASQGVLTMRQTVACLAESHTRGDTTILHFVDAFMEVPLHPAEQPFKCAEVHEVEGQGDYALIFVASTRLSEEKPTLFSARVWEVLLLGVARAWSTPKVRRLQ